MNSSSTSNSDLFKFCRQIGQRLLILMALLACIFLLPIKSKYYNQLMAASDYAKISWNQNKLDATSDMSNDVLFMGSSICLNGVNDSLINIWDTTETEFVNLAVSHTCFALSQAILQEILETRKLKPKHVYLCFKGDAMASAIHNMYPITASPSQIAESIRFGNSLYLPCLLKRVAWNVNALTRFFKYNTADYSKRIFSNYGFAPKGKRSSAAVEKNYLNNRVASEANFNAIDRANKGAEMPWKSKVTILKGDVLENIYFQRQMLTSSAALLDQYEVPYDLIIYPNLISARMGRTDIMENYVRRTFTDIDFSQHEIITINDTAFTNSENFIDINHLNTDGAERLSAILLNHYQAKNARGSK